MGAYVASSVTKVLVVPAFTVYLYSHDAFIQGVENGLSYDINICNILR